MRIGRSKLRVAVGAGLVALELAALDEQGKIG